MIANTTPDMPPVIYVTDGDYKRTAPAFEHEHAYVHADLVRDAMEAMEHAAAPSLPSSKRRMAALSALAKLQAAGL